MAENTKISWATHTLNWWTGCEAISPACQSCYAASWAKRAGRDFAERILTTEANRKQPLKWQRNAAAFLAEHRHRQRVFVNSLSDWADNHVPNEWRASLFAMIRETPDLEYLLLTKRIGNAARMLPADWGSGYPNVWLGATIADQREADRDIPKLLATPAHVRFISCEPLLGSIDLVRAHSGCGDDSSDMNQMGRYCPHIDWVIAGGESGGKARPWHPNWATALRDQCAAAGVPFHWKQHGEWVPICYLEHSDNYFDPKYGNGKRETDRYEAVPPKRRPVTTTVLQLDGTQQFAFPPGAMTCFKVGKKASGRTLDGVIHDAFPQVSR